MEYHREQRVISSNSTEGEEVLKRSMQWDIVGIFALVMSFVSFYFYRFGKADSPFIGLGHPLLMVVFLGFGFMCFERESGNFSDSFHDYD